MYHRSTTDKTSLLVERVRLMRDDTWNIHNARGAVFAASRGNFTLRYEDESSLLHPVATLLLNDSTVYRTTTNKRAEFAEVVEHPYQFASVERVHPTGKAWRHEAK